MLILLEIALYSQLLIYFILLIHRWLLTLLRYEIALVVDLLVWLHRTLEWRLLLRFIRHTSVFDKLLHDDGVKIILQLSS